MDRDTKIVIAQGIMFAVMLPGLVLITISHPRVAWLWLVGPALIGIFFLPALRERWEEWRFRRDMLRRKRHG